MYKQAEMYKTKSYSLLAGHSTAINFVKNTRLMLFLKQADMGK